MLEKNLIEKRFIAVLVAILCTTGLVYANKLGAGNFEQIVIWIVGLFVAGGASDTWAQHYGGSLFAPKAKTEQLNG